CAFEEEPSAKNEEQYHQNSEADGQRVKRLVLFEIGIPIRMRARRLAVRSRRGMFMLARRLRRIDRRRPISGTLGSLFVARLQARFSKIACRPQAHSSTPAPS
ncbi:MAG: hypothetical protein WA636_04450, partial [Methylovirgula sp.]